MGSKPCCLHVIHAGLTRRIGKPQSRGLLKLPHSPRSCEGQVLHCCSPQGPGEGDAFCMDAVEQNPEPETRDSSVRVPALNKPPLSIFKRKTISGLCFTQSRITPLATPLPSLLFCRLSQFTRRMFSSVVGSIISTETSLKFYKKQLGICKIIYAN